MAVSSIFICYNPETDKHFLPRRPEDVPEIYRKLVFELNIKIQIFRDNVNIAGIKNFILEQIIKAMYKNDIWYCKPASYQITYRMILMNRYRENHHLSHYLRDIEKHGRVENLRAIVDDIEELSEDERENEREDNENDSDDDSAYGSMLSDDGRSS